MFKKDREKKETSFYINRTYQRKKKQKEQPLYTLVLLLIVVFLFSLLCVIEYQHSVYSVAYVLKYIMQNVNAFTNWILGNGPTIMINLMFRQYVVITLTGAALGAAGVMFKGIFRNILAAPTTMGVQEGGVLANMLFIALFGSALTKNSSFMIHTLNQISGNNWFQVYGQSLFIFIGCFIGVFFVILIATTAGRHGMSASTLVLAGTMVNGTIAGITGSIQYYLTMNSGDDDLIKILMRVTLGTFDNLWQSMVFPVMMGSLLPVIILLYFCCEKMNIYALGDEEAIAYGMNVNRFRWFIILAGTFLTAITMMFCGHIAFVGFIVPQIALKIYGNNYKKLYPACVLMGGVVMLIVYDVAKWTGLTDGISFITTLIGGIMLIYAILNGQGGTR